MKRGSSKLGAIEWVGLPSATIIRDTKAIEDSMLEFETEVIRGNS